MITERPVHDDIKQLLLSNEPFQYANLIKFERPSRPLSNSGEVSTSKERYTYITDASRNVKFDDGSTDLLGNPNGEQTYVANKVIKMATVQEFTEAKASTYSIVLDGNGLGASAAGEATITDLGDGRRQISMNTDLVSRGFREGDKIALSGLATGYANIDKFRGAGIITTTRIDDDLAVGTGELTVRLASEEIVGVLLDKNAASYASFINREVFIYRAFVSGGNTVGDPFLLFKGIISGVNFDDGDTELTVTWTLTSHWGDFSQVKTRITSDDFHRALDSSGLPQPQSAAKVSYAYDMGFSHAETSINMLSQYTVRVEKTDVKAKSGFLGIGAKTKVKKYYVDEPRTTELDFQLQAKSLPVIYGVKNVVGIPIFADTLNNDSSTVYLIYALSEGEIGGFYDMYVEGNSLICNNKADFDTRSTQTSDETVELICRGRADRGDVLGGVQSSGTTDIPYYEPTELINLASFWAAARAKQSLVAYLAAKNYVAPTLTTTDTTGHGIYDGQSMTLTSPQEITVDFFSGKPGQKAADSLVAIAKSNGFKIQNDYWEGGAGVDYWGPNHRLLDTAYVVVKVKIAEGETTIPDLEFIVRGKLVKCYNYDRSYKHNARVSGENADNFKLGSFVNLYDMDDNLLNSSVQIIDKWTMADGRGGLDTRFRFSSGPDLGYVDEVPTVTSFKMVQGSNTWSMITYNHVEHQLSYSTELRRPITAVSQTPEGFVRFHFNGDSDFVSGGTSSVSSGIYSVTDVDGYPIAVDIFNNAAIVGYSVDTSGITTPYVWSVAGSAAQACVGAYLVRRDAVKIAGRPNGYYNGSDVEVTRLDTSRGRRVRQAHSIVDYYNGIAIIDGMWNSGFHPKPGDQVKVTQAYSDTRVSINPAIQLMDYVCSPTYGRDFDEQDDLVFSSWIKSARVCDEQSNITVNTVNAAPSSINTATKYRYPSSGDLIWQGTVVGSSGNYIEFTDNIGKLTNAWRSWKTYRVNELVYVADRLYRVTSAGVKTTAPTHTSGTVNGLEYTTNVSISLADGPGPGSIPIKTDGNCIRAERDGSIISGYSLYDSDGVDYWRLLGWDESSQRYATRHQTNLAIDTSLPLFDNVNSFLQHFGGILRYSGGKYSLDVEEPEGLITNEDSEYRNITADHIIGKIRLTDEGLKNAYNSLTASYPDPANKFEARNISFFNSNYLESDRNVPKKGNLTVPGISNYYNARLLADKALNKSRFGLSISFNMVPRGLLLQAGEVIQLQYPRYGWVNKKFRISSLTHQEDASVDVVAEEYDDSFYGLSNISKAALNGLTGNTGYSTSISPPSNLTTTNSADGTETITGIKLAWINNPSLVGSKNAYTEIYSSYSPRKEIAIQSIVDNLWTTSGAHGMRLGEPITIVSSSMLELFKGEVLYVIEIPSSSTFRVSTERSGDILGVSNNGTPDVVVDTSLLLSTVPITTASYIDMIPGVDSSTVKYYWLRHKIVKAG